MTLNLARVGLSTCGSMSWRLLPASVSTLMSKRTIIDKGELRMDMYTRQRVAYNDRLLAASSNREKYVAKLTEQMANEKNTVFSEDLNTLMTVAETKEDAALAVNMLKRLQAQIKANIVHQDYHFGPVVMRMFHYLRLPEDALACYKDPVFKDVFANVISGTLMLDALFDGGKYQDVVDTYDILKNKFPDWHYPRSATFLFIAASYKLGTPEAFEKVRAVITDIARQKTGITVRAATIAALFAIKQKNLDFITECERTLSMPERCGSMLCIRVLKALDQGNHEQTVSLLDFIRRQFAARRNPVVTSDVVKRIDELITKFKAETSETAKNYAVRLETVRKELSNDNLLDSKTFEDLLFAPIVQPGGRFGVGPGRRDDIGGGPRRFGDSGFRRDGPPGAGGFGPRRFGPGGQGRFGPQPDMAAQGAQGRFAGPRQFGGPGQFSGPRQFGGPREFGNPREFGGPRQFGEQRQAGGVGGQFVPRPRFGGPGQFRPGPQGGLDRNDDATFDGPAPPPRAGPAGPAGQRGPGSRAPARRRQLEEDEDDD